ncbi:DOMON domain-containing protein [Thiotrichales bacterium 19S11-10]|nr:DOMON domain-containing protein [Thiotrichales bacterium 19S11-10]
MLKKILLILSVFQFFNSANATLWQIDENFEINYQTQNEKLAIDFTLKNNKTGWMAVCFHEFMFPADCIIAWVDQQTKQPVVWDAYNPGIPTMSMFPSPIQDIDPLIKIEGGSPLDNKANVKITGFTNTNGTIQIKCERDLETGDIFDLQFTPGVEYHVVAAYNEKEGFNNEFQALQPMHSKVGSQLWMIAYDSDE